MDASGVGFGGSARTQSGREFRIAGTFSQTEAQGSSAEREIAGYAAALQVITEQAPDELAGRSVLVIGDSQAGVNALIKFRSPVPFINSALKKVVELNGNYDFDVTTRWVPRENLAEADALSREPDPSDWALSPAVFRDVTRFFAVQPAVDLFASGEQHVAAAFVSKYYTPGCAGVNAQAQDWKILVLDGQCAWIFPPPGLAGVAINLLQRFQIEALLCVSAPEGSMIKTQVAAIAPRALNKVFRIPKLEDSCRPSLRVPRGTKNPAFLGLCVWHVVWPQFPT